MHEVLHALGGLSSPAGSCVWYVAGLQRSAPRGLKPICSELKPDHSGGEMSRQDEHDHVPEIGVGLALIIRFTRSPIETMPTNRSVSTTGR